MPDPVRLSAIVEGMDMQSDAMTSYLHRLTGRVVTVSEEALRAAEADDEEWVEPEELADARGILEDGDQYLALPDRLAIDEYRMMERFAAGLEDAAARDAALVALRGAGAFRRFKDTVRELGIAASWYAYRNRAFEDVARAWCEAHGIAYDAPDADARIVDGSP